LCKEVDGTGSQCGEDFQAGIDVFLLRGAGDESVAVQAKRNKVTRKIGIEEIDRFVGALIRKDLQRGIFVTTSSFTKGAYHGVEEIKQKGLFIELWDANVLLKSIEPISIADAAEVAWSMRYAVPTENEKIGDYFGPEGTTWPTMLPSDKELAHWSYQLERKISGCDDQ